MTTAGGSAVITTIILTAIVVILAGSPWLIVEYRLRKHSARLEQRIRDERA
jgi:flagellin-like protein